MKKAISIFLMIVLILGISTTGCSKADQQKDDPAKQQTVQKEEKAQDIDYVLYLKHNDKPFIFDERYTIKENDERLKGKTFEEFVVNELINLEGFGEFVNPIPKGTKLLSLERENGIITVNLSKEFVEGQKGSENDTLLTMATIINSLAILPDNEEVAFMIEGEKVDEINGVDTQESFKYLDGFYPDK